MANENNSPPTTILSSSPTLPSSPSEMEVKFYYAGLPSSPVLVARTGAPWKAPTGPEAYRVIRELRPVGNHALKLQEVWEDNLAFKLHTLLDSMKVKWTSTDVVRIGNVDESFAPVVLWIGVIPASLSGDDGVVVAFKCQELLREYDITDVEVEIRESVVTRSAGPRFLTSTHCLDPTVDVRDPLTTTLGLPISVHSSQSTPQPEGTGGFFITENGKPNRLLLVTAHHAVFTPNWKQNELFEYRDITQARHNVMLFGKVGFQKYLDSIKTQINTKKAVAGRYEKKIASNVKNEDLEMFHVELDKTKKAIEALDTFRYYVETNWALPDSRILGHVVLSPPIGFGVGSEGFTEDWAVIEIDPSKVDKNNFQGNAIDLGTEISEYEFSQRMHPSIKNAHSFDYPDDRLLRLRGTIPDDEMRRPTACNQDDEHCLVVIKRGITTGLTIGRANNICSYSRNYFGHGHARNSKEWAILPYNSKSGPFSDKGDSGSVIVDGLGRIGGLLTGGAGFMDSSDITYATPISFLLKRMQEHGLKPNLNPVLTT
ncbi:hypothetical protein VKT23_014257 [Stygiomarasmius scandens]|uniref:Uncharacterized protein n=1 Tax=Marasmiellus scandens TaxID=2682957 RepID=A0ABR1J5M1_9AGAR